MSKIKNINSGEFFAYFLITIGAAIVAVAINTLYSPNQLVIGGVTGLAIVLESVTAKTGFPIPVWLTNIVANIPLFFLGFKMFGFKTMAKTVYATILLTVFLFLTDSLSPIMTDDLFLVAIFGGVLEGVGLALIFRFMATTGGTDTAASLIHKSILPHVTIQQIMFCIDALIIALGFFVFGIEKGMYAIISVFIMVKAIDSILEGLSFAKCTFIISEKTDEISKMIMEEISRGVTMLRGVGMYTKKEKNVLLCVVSNKEIVGIKKCVHEIDPQAFLIVADVREVLGAGFIERS